MKPRQRLGRKKRGLDLSHRSRQSVVGPIVSRTLSQALASSKMKPWKRMVDSLLCSFETRFFDPTYGTEYGVQLSSMLIRSTTQSMQTDTELRSRVSVSPVTSAQ
jgi:hypothetical protein